MTHTRAKGQGHSVQKLSGYKGTDRRTRRTDRRTDGAHCITCLTNAIGNYDADSITFFAIVSATDVENFVFVEIAAG